MIKLVTIYALQHIYLLLQKKGPPEKLGANQNPDLTTLYFLVFDSLNEKT